MQYFRVIYDVINNCSNKRFKTSRYLFFILCIGNEKMIQLKIIFEKYSEAVIKNE